MWIKLKEMFGGSTSHLVGGDSEELSSPSHHEELQVASTSGRDEFSSSSTSPTCSKTREETEHSMDQDMFSNEDSRISSSSSSGMHMCLMANGSKVSPTLTPNTSSNDESDDDDNDEEYNILVHNMAMIYASLHEEIKELEAQVLSLKKDLEKRHEGKSALDKMLSVQQSPNDKSGLGFNSNNKNKSKSKSNKNKGQDKVKDPAKLVCFKCKVEGHHVRSCPLKKKKHLSEKQQGKRPQGQGQAHARPQVEDRPLPKKNQHIVPQEKKSIKKRKGNTCYLCHMASPINFNQFLEKEKLKSNGSNFTDWFRHVRIFLNGGNLQYVLDAPLGDPPAETETDEVKNVYATRKTRYSQVQCAILCSLEADLQKRFEHHDPHELINELKTIFETHAAVECYEASKHFFSCMMEEGSSVSEHMLAMTGHAKKLSDLGIVIPNRLGINRVLQSLPPSYKNFVMNYNMQNMNKELPELFAMLKSAEIEIKKEHQVLMVNKTTSFKKQGKSKGKNKKSGKKAATPPVKPKSGPKPDAECYYCKEKGHWKRNCSKYLADLKSGLVKKKKEGISDIHELKNKRRLLKDEVTMRVGNGSKVDVIAVGTLPLHLPSGLVLSLNNCYFVPALSMNIISGSCLMQDGYSFKSENNGCSIFMNNIFYGRAPEKNETAAFTLNRAPSKSVETTPYELWFNKKPKLSFLKVWGCEAYVKKLQPDKLEPKAEKCVFIGYPKETIGYTFYHRSEGKIFVAKNGTFLEKEFLTKEVTGRKVELDEIEESLLVDQSSAVPEDVPVPPAPATEEANDNDHETSNEITTEPRRSTRERATPDWYDPCLNVMIVDNNDEDPATYEEAMMSPDSNKWQEAMKSEMGSMYDNKVWTLVDLPDSRKAVENKWIFKRKIDADGMEHWTAVKNILKYLKRTKDMFLCYGGDQELVVTSYTDASWNTDPDDSKSQSGYVFILNGAAVSWASSKQCTVAKSSTESEYIAASEASSEAVWMKRFIVELGVVPSALDPLVIYCDNMGAIANAQEPRSHKRLKHIKLRGDPAYHCMV
ncbi:hypothetical protein QYE76_013442 [Lolium multiflorum]|uniref:CCHC-type domain-containing protein n=1 Tax=Lolium multiflorum TaxID=4521 RepID=A0AAD8TYU4_LOLMU|nr:hypothetical protein QYE76_013442 [Lolium multiflorum]